MSEYKRLTDKDWKNKYAFGTCSKSDGECDIYKDCFDMVQRLAELEDEIENGTLVRLPAPLGSDLWTIEYPTHKMGQVTVTTLSIQKATVEKHKYPLSFSNVDMVGKYYFLTKEEADANLRELKGEK